MMLLQIKPINQEECESFKRLLANSCLFRCVPGPTPKPDNCQLNECHPSAECISLSNGYSCRCRNGFKDFNPQTAGKDCRPLIDECETEQIDLNRKFSGQFVHLNDCSPNAQCHDLDEGFSCKCNAGFKDMNPQRPGRICKRLINECSDARLNSCDKNAICIDREEGYGKFIRKGRYRLLQNVNAERISST